MDATNCDPQLHVFAFPGKRSEYTGHQWWLTTVEQGVNTSWTNSGFSSCVGAQFRNWAIYSHSLASGSQQQEISWQLSYRIILGCGFHLTFSAKLGFGIKKYKLCLWNSVESGVGCHRNMMEHVNIMADTRLNRIPFWVLRTFFSCFWAVSDAVETCQIMPKLYQKVLVMWVRTSWVSHWILSGHDGTC